MSKIRSVCVFCGSRVGLDDKYREDAIKLGEIFLKNDIQLVYGGGRIGLMGVIADTLMEGGGRVVGVIPEFLDKLEVGHEKVSELVITNNMHSRKSIMFERADAFVTLPGGIGTLEETFEIATWKQLGLHSKPLIILNTKRYWKGLSGLIDNIIAEEFGNHNLRDVIKLVHTPEEVLTAFDTFK